MKKQCVDCEFDDDDEETEGRRPDSAFANLVAQTP
jgi:hypothetical protein